MFKTSEWFLIKSIVLLYEPPWGIPGGLNPKSLISFCIAVDEPKNGPYMVDIWFIKKYAPATIIAKTINKKIDRKIPFHKVLPSPSFLDRYKTIGFIIQATNIANNKGMKLKTNLSIVDLNEIKKNNDREIIKRINSNLFTFWFLNKSIVDLVLWFCLLLSLFMI